MKNGLGAIQTAVFIGATSEICQRIIAQLCESGLENVVLCGRDDARLSALSNELANSFQGLEVREIHFDAEDSDSIADLIPRIVQEFGDIDLCILAHGFLGNEHLSLVSPQVGAATAQINFTANVVIGLALAKQFRLQCHGCLVFISSFATVRVRRSLPVYGAAKAASDDFFRAIDHFLDKFHSRAIIVRPGFVETRMTAHHPVPPFASTPAQVSDAVVKALSQGKHVVWVPKKLRLAALLFTILPEPVWRKLNEWRLETQWTAEPPFP